VALPAGEARGNFAISPLPNLSFPGNEPGGRAGNGASPNTSNSNNSTTPGNNRNAGTATGPNNAGDVFPGITILGPDDNPGNSRNTISLVGDQPDKSAPAPLQTSYGITLIASGGSGGGLPDFGLFVNEQVHTVYLDMRRTIQDEPISWTAEFGIKHREATAENERITNVGGQQEVSLPFPITKERPTMPNDVVRKYPGRLIIAYAIVNTEGKMEQLSIKQSPDPALNDAVLSALKKWTFRPARRDGEVIPAKILLGIPVRAN
jgi:TonB family protein